MKPLGCPVPLLACLYTQGTERRNKQPVLCEFLLYIIITQMCASVLGDENEQIVQRD